MARQNQAWASMGKHDQGRILRISPPWWKLSSCHCQGLHMPGQLYQATKIHINIGFKFQYLNVAFALLQKQLFDQS